MPSTKFATPFLTMLPLPDALLKLVTVFFIMSSGKKKLMNMSPQSFYTLFQKALCAVKLLDHCCKKELDNDKENILIFIHFPRNTFKIMYIMVTVTLIWKPWKTSRISFKAIILQINPKNDKQNDWHNKKGLSLQLCCLHSS